MEFTINSNYFIEILLKSNIIITSNNKIICSNIIKSTKQFNINIKQLNINKLELFINSMYYYINNLNNNFKIIMESFDNNNEINNFYGQNETLIRLLMKNNIIQEKLIQLLINKMISLSSDNNNDNNKNNNKGELELLILNHIRWCDVIYQPSTVITLLLESVPVREFNLFIIS